MTKPAEPNVVSDTTPPICVHCGKTSEEHNIFDGCLERTGHGKKILDTHFTPVPECAQAEIPEERAHAPVAERDQKAAIPEKCVHAPEIDLSAFDGHTPGPWTTLDYHDGSVVVASGDCNICDIEHKGVTRHGDARLIAAAPTLLADLRVLRAERDQLRMERDAALESLRYIRELVHKRQLPITNAVWESADATLERLARPIPAEPKKK